MTNVLWETFGQIWQHSKEGIASTAFFIAFSAAANVIVRRHEDDSILQTFSLNVAFLHHVLDCPEELRRSVPWENIHSNTTGSPLSRSRELRQIVNILQFSLRDKAPNLKRRRLLLSIPKKHIHATKHFSSMEFDSNRSWILQIFHLLDHGSTSA